MESGLSKRDRILSAAKACFLNYGFKKTAMSDIANQADMSRPALYLHFDNKETIFCEIVKQLHRQTLKEAEAALKQKHSIIQCLTEAFEYRTIVLFATVNDSHHGNELTDVNSKVASEINRASMNKFMQLISQALDEAIKKRQIQLDNLNITTMQAAEMLVNSAHGIKQAATSTDDFRDRLKQLLKMFEQATTVD